jgi:hypothetical protein
MSFTPMNQERLLVVEDPASISHHAAFIVILAGNDTYLRDRAKFIYQQRLSPRDPNVIDYQIAAEKARNVQVFGLLNGLACSANRLNRGPATSASPCLITSSEGADYPSCD